MQYIAMHYLKTHKLAEWYSQIWTFTWNCTVKSNDKNIKSAFPPASAVVLRVKYYDYIYRDKGFMRERQFAEFWPMTWLPKCSGTILWVHQILVLIKCVWNEPNVRLTVSEHRHLYTRKQITFEHVPGKKGETEILQTDTEIKFYHIMSDF